MWATAVCAETQRCSLFPSSLRPARVFIFFLSGSLLLVWGVTLEHFWVFLWRNVQSSWWKGGYSSLEFASPFSVCPLPWSGSVPRRKPRQHFPTLSAGRHLCSLFSCSADVCAAPSSWDGLLLFLVLGNESHGKNKAETVSDGLRLSAPPSSIASTCCLYLLSQIRPAICNFHSPWDTEWGRSVKTKVKCGYNINRNVDCEYRLKICSCR